MKLVIVALALVAVALAAPAAPPVSVEKVVQIVRSEFNQKPEGSYVYSYEADNGISRQENGDLKEVKDEENKPHEVVVVRGQYAYTDTDGKPVVVTYYADETGFHAEGDSIPKAAARR